MTMLKPKKVKYKKIKKGKLSKYNFKFDYLKFGTIGLKTLKSGILTAKQIEASRQAIVRKMKRKGKIWINIFPNMPITFKPIETRMGKGKGSFSHWAIKVKGGSILFEISGIPHNLAKNALKTGAVKLPLKTKIFV